MRYSAAYEIPTHAIGLHFARKRRTELPTRACPWCLAVIPLEWFEKHCPSCLQVLA